MSRRRCPTPTAWGRLVKVSRRGNLALEPGGGLAAEGVDPLEPNEPGDWIIHYTYDALGRLVRAQRPVPASAGGLPGDVYTEHYYVDGVRRV